MDFCSSGRQDTFRYMRVDGSSWKESEEINGITGGSLDRNDLTSIKASGSLDYIDAPMIGRDYLRIYSDSIYPPTGERVSIAHGTYIVATPSSTYRGAIEKGTTDLYSVLQILAGDAFEEPLVLPTGTPAVSKASEIIAATGLPVIASTSSSTLNAPAVFDNENASKLDVVNWLMGFAGFDSASCDGYGNVLLRPYVDPTSRMPTVALHDDEKCIYRAEVVRDYDIFDVPNVVVVTCSSVGDESAMIAESVNDDPMSEFSTVTRGHRIVTRETVSGIDSQAALQAKADALLAAKTSAVESFEVSHAYIPMEMGEVCDFRYAAAGIRRDDIAAVRQTMKLRPGMECTTRFRRFMRS